MPRVVEVVRRSEVNIVVATGAYVLHDPPLYFHHRDPGAPLDGPDLQYENVVVELCRRATRRKMVLSHDTSCWSDMSDPVLRREQHPDWHWPHIPRDVVPALLTRGVTQAQVLVVNPPPDPRARRRLLGGRHE